MLTPGWQSTTPSLLHPMFVKIPHRLPIGSATSATKFMSLRRCEAHSAGTDRGDEETEEKREGKDKFVPKSERFPSMSAPLKTGGYTEGDQEDPVE
jgi:hypothetical protein